MRIELVLAVVTPVPGVGAIVGIIELARADDLVRQTKVARNPDRELRMTFGIAGTVCGDGNRAIAENAMRDVREVRAVYAAAVRDDNRAELLETIAEDGLLTLRSSRLRPRPRRLRRHRDRLRRRPDRRRLLLLRLRPHLHRRDP